MVQTRKRVAELPAGMKVRKRRTWRNHTGDQRVDPLLQVTPKTLEQLVGTVRYAEAEGLAVRAVGSGHSWSDVALTPDIMVHTNKLTRTWDEVDWMRKDYPGADKLVRTEAGVPLRVLNRRLEARNPSLALENLGGWDAQTIAGVMSTSTHGSGLTFGPLCDQIVSIDLVASGGRLLRLERGDGPTDPAAFKEANPEWSFETDSAYFDAALVGMGCLGIIYAVTVRAVEFFYLEERRWTESWPEVSRGLSEKWVENPRVEHVELYVNPHRRRGRNLALVTTRKWKSSRNRWLKVNHRNFLAECVGRLTRVTGPLIDIVLSTWPRITPWFLDMALKAIVKTSYVNKCHKVFKLGTANLLPAYSMEIAIPMEGERPIEAVEAIFEVAAKRRATGQVYQSSPIALRFVKSSPAYLSMMHGRDTMMIELIGLRGNDGGYELLAAYEEALYPLGGRPHWGQINALSGNGEEIAALYPRYADWLAVRAQLDPDGVFDSPFTDRVGIS